MSSTVQVALLAEGVDRNLSGTWGVTSPDSVALLAEGVDRNNSHGIATVDGNVSPSSRRAWIEILKRFGASHLSACRPPRGGRG